VKLAHYRWLAAEANGWSVPDGYRAEVARALRGMEELARRLADEAFVADYLARVNAGWRSLPRGWWGAAVDPATAAALPAAR
jgi:hypothetical protein